MLLPLMKSFIIKINALKQIFGFDPLTANPTKRSNTLKQFLGNFPRNCLSVFGYFVGYAHKGLTDILFSLVINE